MDPPIRETWPGPIISPISRQSAPGPEFFRPETKPKFRPVSPARDQISKIMRRTGRANAACSRKVSVIRDSGNCVVADAVLVEPVSNAEFPANREINREFRQIRSLRCDFEADTRANSAACSEIPCATEQGIISKEQGICTQRTGNLNQPSSDFERFGEFLIQFGAIDAERRDERQRSASKVGTLSSPSPSKFPPEKDLLCRLILAPQQ